MNDFDLVPLQHGDIDEFAGFFGRTSLHHQQTGEDDFENQTKRRKIAGDAPNPQLIVLRPNAQMKTGSLDGSGELGEIFGVQGKRIGQGERIVHFFRRNEREGNARYVAFLPAQAGPESGIDHRG